jgi:hypothetical protein
MYEGYKFNLAVWNNKARQYITNHKHIKINIRNPLVQKLGFDAEQKKPNFIIMSDIVLKNDGPGKNTYSFNSADSISVLDGYVDPDLSYFKN